MRKFLSLEKFIYLTIFLLPSYLIKFNIFGLPTNVLEILILISLAWALFLRISPRSSLGLHFRLAIGLILGGLTISTLVNGNYLVGLGIIKGWFVLPLLLAFVAKNVIPQERSKSIYVTLYASGLAVAVVSYGYYIAGQVTFDGRLEGFFNSPNYLAMYLTPAIMIGVVSIWKEATSNGEKIAWGASIMVILGALYLTYSYAAWISLGISLYVLILLQREKKTKFKYAAAITGLALLLVLSQWNSQKFQDLRNVSARSSFQSRGMIWSAAKKMVTDDWIWGIGPGNFQTKYLEYQKYFPPYLEWAVPHPHSVYLAFWLNAGAVGLIGFGLLIYFWLREMIKKEQTVVWFVSFGIMLLFLIHGLVDTTYFKNDLASIFWLNFIFIL